MRRRKSAIFFLVFGICLVALAVALNVGWILLNLQQLALLVFGIIFFALIITGLVLNTTFLVREIRRNEQQNAFLNAMTHELKTPIASIRLYLETLKSRELSDEKRDEFYDIMLADSDRLLNTVEEVLLASRTREKSRSLRMTRIDLRELLLETSGLIKTRYHLEPGAIRLAERDAAVYVSGDKDELGTVFLNLFDNAVKYSIDGAVDILVKIRPVVTGSVEVAVRDKGIGLSPTDASRVFKRFYRSSDESTGNTKGTGLGLYIVESIVKKHGGKVFVKSRGQGKGCTFTVRLPIAKELKAE